MSDYYPLLSRVVAGLDTKTGESRRALYGRARAALGEQLRGHEPPLTDSEITRERLSLEAAIRKFEAEAIRNRWKPMRTDPGLMAGDIDPAHLKIPPPPPGAPAESRQFPPDRPQHGPRAAAREPPIELSVLAQAVETWEMPIRNLLGTARPGQGGDFLGAPQLHHPPTARQRMFALPLPEVQQVIVAQDLLTKLVEARQKIKLDNNANQSSSPTETIDRTLLRIPRAGDLVTPVFGILYFALGFVQLIAFFRGLQTGFGLGGVASIGIFMMLYLTGSWGSIPMAIVAFYGAWRGWQWPIWGAALFVFPFVALSFAFLGTGGFYSFFRWQKAPPPLPIIGPSGAEATERPIGWRSAPGLLSWQARWRARARGWRAALGRLVRMEHQAAHARSRRPRRGSGGVSTRP